MYEEYIYRPKVSFVFIYLVIAFNSLNNFFICF